MGIYYVSLVEMSRDEFYAAAVVEAESCDGALDVAQRMATAELGSGFELDALVAEITMDAPEERFRGRLLTKAEVSEMWPDAVSIREWEETSPELN